MAKTAFILRLAHSARKGAAKKEGGVKEQKRRQRWGARVRELRQEEKENQKQKVELLKRVHTRTGKDNGKADR